jgi:hypothetical protein
LRQYYDHGIREAIKLLYKDHRILGAIQDHCSVTEFQAMSGFAHEHIML